MRSTTEFPSPSTSLNITAEGFPVLDALSIVTRSLHNCRVFGYYSGIQKLTALMKGIIIDIVIGQQVFLSVELMTIFLVNYPACFARKSNIWVCLALWGK